MGNTCNGENNSTSRRALRKGQYPGAASRVLGKAFSVKASFGKAQAGFDEARVEEDRPRCSQAAGSEADLFSGDGQGDLLEALGFLQAFSDEGGLDF